MSPTLARAHYSCPDNAIGLVSTGQAVEGSGIFLITTNVYVDQTLCTFHIPHKLNIDSNRNTVNIKIAIENANFCGKICYMRTLLKYAKK